MWQLEPWGNWPTMIVFGHFNQGLIEASTVSLSASLEIMQILQDYFHRLTHCLPHCLLLSHCLSHGLSHCLSHCLSNCLPYYLPHCLPHCLPHYLPHCLSFFCPPHCLLSNTEELCRKTRPAIITPQFVFLWYCTAYLQESKELM